MASQPTSTDAIHPDDAVDIVNGVAVLRHRGRCGSDCFCGSSPAAEPRLGWWRRLINFIDEVTEVREDDPRPYG